MQPGMIKGFTRILGKRQGYIGLPIRDYAVSKRLEGPAIPIKDGLINDKVNGPLTPIMESCWFPTPEEMLAMAQGAPVLLRVLGTTHPPVYVGTGEVPEEKDGKVGK